MDKINLYLNFLQEREWDEPGNFDEYLKAQRFIELIRNLDGSDKLADDRHDMQPTLIGLIMTAGGDYKGRKDLANMKSDSHSGLKKIMKYLPNDIKEKLRKSLNIDIGSK